MTLPDIEVVSAKVHDAWMDSKRAQGVTTRKAEDGEELMVPYGQLSDKAKQLDRGSVQAVYAAIAASAPSETPRKCPHEEDCAATHCNGDCGFGMRATPVTETEALREQVAKLATLGEAPVREAFDPAVEMNRLFKKMDQRDMDTLNWMIKGRASVLIADAALSAPTETEPKLDSDTAVIRYYEKRAEQEQAKVVDAPALHQLCEIFGWQGGTIHQAMEEVRRLKASAPSATRQNPCKLCNGTGYVIVREAGTHAANFGEISRMKCNCDGTISQPGPEPEKHEPLACEDEDAAKGRQRGGL